MEIKNEKGLDYFIDKVLVIDCIANSEWAYSDVIQMWNYLQEQIQKMKCCNNCKYCFISYGDWTQYCEHPSLGKGDHEYNKNCKEMEQWELGSARVA